MERPPKHRSRMEHPVINEQLVRRYLLGDLPRRERERLEAGMLSDDRYYQTLTALEDEIEDELIDQYLDDELTEKERENFERVFLNTPERTYKLKVIGDLKNAAGEKNVKPGPFNNWIPAVAIFQNPLYGFSSATALALAVLCCVWLWMRSNSLEAQLRQAKAEYPTDPALRAQVEQLTQEKKDLTARLQRSEEEVTGLRQVVATLDNRKTPDAIPPDKTSPREPRSFPASLTLSPIVRSGDKPLPPPILPLRPGITYARLVLNVQRVDPKDYKRFHAVVRKEATGEEVWSDDHVKLQQKGTRAILNVPTEKLAEGNYVGILDGISPDEQSQTIGLYHFRIVYK